MRRRLLSTSGLLLAGALFIAVNIIANGTLTSWRLDVTENKLFSLSSGTKNILKNLDEPITLRFYFSAKQFSGIPSLSTYGTRVRDMLEEYVAASEGKLKLIVTDPEPFSEAEDQAVGYGIQQLPVSTTGELAYFGLAGTNTTDDELTIPFFQPENERSLEYEITKVIYNLANPRERVIGVISTLPVFGDGTTPLAARPADSTWAIISLLQEEFEIRNLGKDLSHLDEDIDTLLVIHPKALSAQTRYGIDQFVLKGGKAMIFVDPLAESDTSGPDPQSPMAMPQRGSDLPDLFKQWGAKYAVDKVAGDLDAAIRVSYAGSRGTREMEYMPWLHLGPPNFNQDDFVTSQLKAINLGSVGILEKAEDSPTEFTPLLSTGKRSMPYERDAVLFIADPAGLLNSFESSDKELVLAARLSGKVKTAFPGGKPKQSEDDPDDPAFVTESTEPINVIVVADTDLLTDRFWVQFQNFLGITVPSALADNASFVINALDNLGGNHDLISLRSRSEYARPFARVEAIQHEAETKFRAREQALRTKLEQTESKLRELQKQKDEGSGLLLSAEQRQEIDTFRREQLKTRKELRAVQHDLRKNIERLGTILKFVNISMIPLLIGILAIVMAIYRVNRRASS